MAGDSAGLRLLATEAEALGTTVDALALAWVMSHDWVDVCLSGAATVEQAAHTRHPYSYSDPKITGYSMRNCKFYS